LAYLLRDLLIYAGVVGALVVIDSPWLLPPLWLLAGLAISALFVVGHDAAHGSLFKSRRLSRAVGQFAMLPSLHLYEAWVFGHNRIHHGHTIRQGMDYVWHPLTPEEYSELSLPRRIAHRLKWSCWGAGIYYMHEIWWQKMIWNFEPPKKIATAIRRDRFLVGSYAFLVSGALLVAGVISYGGVLGALWMWVKVFAIPFVIWNYSIGFAVYVHHICPEIAWRTRREWSRFIGQLAGTTIIYLPSWLNFFYHNIFLHVTHHVSMRVPFYHLPEATRVLRENFGDIIVERAYGVRDYLDSTRRCKLFDFEAGRWVRYGEREDAGTVAPRTPASPVSPGRFPQEIR
jgi:omega-6 fatty acid desaturase (delta-12 desaturase)